jgi:hypothetical protein
MLQNVAYCPTLHTRVAEIKALFQLPAVSKDRIFPLVISRPWPNANELERTWEKFSEAFGNRRFALDLDRSRRGASSSKAAAEQFNRLFDAADGFSAYYEHVEAIPSAIPVLRLHGGIPADFERQAERIDSLDRGVVVRLGALR